MKACRHCHRSTMSTDAVARAQGWRWYDGPTVSGGHLVDVVCPICAGNTTAAESERWDVVCETCDWSYEEGDPWNDEDALTDSLSAVRVGRDHECEPQIRLKAPDGEYFDLRDFDRDGKLREKVATG